MKSKFLLPVVLLLVCFNAAFSQVSVTNASPIVLVDFSNTMQTSVGTNPSTAFEGDGFQPNPTSPGRLNSNAWEVKGWSYGDCLFGATQTVDDFGRGSVNGGVVTPGIYSYTDNPQSVANPAILIQPGAADFAPGYITLKIKNNGTSNMTQINLSYDLFVRNDENSSSSFKFSHSPDNLVYVQEPLLDYVTPDVLDAFQWVKVTASSPSRNVAITGLNIAPGGFYYVRWSCADVTVSGARDEIGLDSIRVEGIYGAPAPEVNVTCYGATILSGDTTPTIGEGTEYAPIYAPQSTLLTQLLITYYIENLGGLPLNITNITITGPDAIDFTISGTMPTGPIPAASATISSKGLTINFDPSLAGLRQARVNIFTNDSDENPYWFDIQGYGVIPLPDIRINGGPTGGVSIVTSGSLVPSSFNNTLFGSQTVGTSSAANGFEIRNDCPFNAPVVLTGPSPYVTIIGANPADFTLVTIPAGASISPGFKKQFSIKFNPTAPGIRTAIVSIDNNDPDENPYTFLIQGTGVAPEIDMLGNAQPIISGSTTSSIINYTFFDYVNITSGFIDRTFTIKNTGNVALTIGALTITGTNAADFSVVTAPPASVAIAGTATFVIRFDPSAVGLRNARINLVNNDPDENPFTFAISGYGLDYIPCSLGAIQTIATQDFETAPAAPVWSYTATGTSTLSAGTAFAVTGDSGLTNKFLGARSLQVSNGTGTLTFGSINTSSYNSVELNFRLASMALTAAEGADVTDKVTVAVSSNGGTTWSNEMDVTGNTDAKWGFASGTATATSVFDNNNVVTAISPAAGGFLTGTGYSTVSLTGLPAVSSLIVRLTIANNSASETWAVDNVTLYGRQETFTTWNGASWSPAAPTANTKAVIDGNYDTAVNGSIHACKCDIKAGRTVTVNTNTYFDVESDLTNLGTMTIENSGSLVQHNDLAINTGIVKVKRNTTPMRIYDYTYWSSPVTGQTLFALSPNTTPDKYYSFNPVTGLWISHPGGTDVMIKALGYIIRAPQSFTATPQPFNTEFNGVPNNGFIQVPIQVGVSNQNLIGNPFPCAISANAFLSNAANTGVVEGTIYLWTHNTPITSQAYNNNDFAVYNLSGSVATRASISTGVNPTVPTGNIASGQGFVIKGLANGQATFTNGMRLTGSNASFFRPGNASASADTGDNDTKVWLNLTSGEDIFKQSLVSYSQGATNEYDRGYDGEIIAGNAYVNFYSINSDKNLAIQGRAMPFDEQDKVALGYSATIDGTFSISIDHTEGILDTHDIFLKDNLLNIIHNLKESSYTFTSEIGTFDDRFELRYTDTSLATNIFDAEASTLIVTAKDKQIGILSQKGNIREIGIYDLPGRNVFKADNIGQRFFSVRNIVSANQALIVKITLEDGQIVTRKVIL